MCGRYSVAADAGQIAARFQVEVPQGLAPRYNLAPSQNAPIVVSEDGRRRLELFRWGLVPFWAKDPAIGHRMINAKAETLSEKPSFRRSFERRRCLVVADGFYEWRKEAGGKLKTPMRMALKSGGLFAMAGLWDAWTGPDGREVRTFTIVTTDACGELKTIHDRMPAILAPRDEDAWLGPRSAPQKLSAALKPCAGGDLEAYEVSRLVNSPKNDMAELIRPLAYNPR